MTIPGGNGAAKTVSSGPRQDRYEFVVLFIWKEPLSIAQTEEKK
jgi:hypothetical protein